MRFLRPFAFLLLAAALPCLADDASKRAKIADLVKLQGLEPQIAAVMAKSRGEGERAGAQMMQQMAQSFELPPEMAAKLDAIQRRFLHSLDPAFTPEDVVRIWVDNYAV